ncbi:MULTISPECIES: acyl carrier protein [Rhizobium]|uniref:Acyl carrier protein n=3 Tax=Rhizobium TaxID=379 RepID=I2AWM1_RHITR|nr:MULTISPECIES: acyl carrier protein [Rhizobium]AFJ42563.1 NodF [Rhizobium tropici]AGB73495.1 acyl carrier protein NodF [Rhizobium tropici CIAT 899]AYG70421.1 acyl carrier protein [Rhizobium sp. CCGE531]AYG76955.1 acyl carrier protein [Rhizobium sp. CCGE532]ENN84753.1 acyl carrier protein NodF [Rhizobium freirei PRF 81]
MPDQIADNVIAMIKKNAAAHGTDKDPSLSDDEITTETELSSLDIDSITLADILWDLEQAYDIGIEFNTAEAWANLKSVGDLIEAVRALIAREA